MKKKIRTGNNKWIRRSLYITCVSNAAFAHAPIYAEASLGLGGRPPLPQGKRKKKKWKKKKKKRKKRKKVGKKEKKKGTMNNVKWLHIKCCFFSILSGGIENKNKNFGPQENVEMTYLNIRIVSDKNYTELLILGAALERFTCTVWCYCSGENSRGGASVEEPWCIGLEKKLMLEMSHEM